MNEAKRSEELYRGSCSPSLDCPFEEFREFYKSLKVGERVIELGESGMKGQAGTIVLGREGVSVQWDTDFDGSRMTTAVTGGTRRLL